MSAVENLDQERRITFCLYEYWEKLTDGTSLPALKDMSREQIAPFKNYLTLLDLRENVNQPTFQVVGQALQEDLETDLTHKTVNEVPRRSMLSRVVDHYREVLANRVPIAFEAEFVNSGGEKALYRGILLPFSDDKENINFILGGVRWILEKDLTLDETKPTIEELMKNIAAGRAQQEHIEPEKEAAQNDSVTEMQEPATDETVPSEIMEEAEDEALDARADADNVLADKVLNQENDDQGDAEAFTSDENEGPVIELSENTAALNSDTADPEEDAIFNEEDKEEGPTEDMDILAPDAKDDTVEPILARKDFLPEAEDENEIYALDPENETSTPVQKSDANETISSDSDEAQRMASEILESLSTSSDSSDLLAENDILPHEGDVTAQNDIIDPEETPASELSLSDTGQNDVDEEKTGEPSAEQSLSFQEIIDSQLETDDDLMAETSPEDVEVSLIDALEQSDDLVEKTPVIQPENDEGPPENTAETEDIAELSEPKVVEEEPLPADTFEQTDADEDKSSTDDSIGGGGGDDLSIEELMESIIAERKFDASYMREQKASQSFDISEQSPPASENSMVDESEATGPDSSSEIPEEKDVRPQDTIEDDMIWAEGSAEASETEGQNNEIQDEVFVATERNNIETEEIGNPGFGDAIPEFLTRKDPVKEVDVLDDINLEEHKPATDVDQIPGNEDPSKVEETAALDEHSDSSESPQTHTSNADDPSLFEEENDDFLIEDDTSADDLNAFVASLEEDTHDDDEQTEDTVEAITAQEQYPAEEDVLETPEQPFVAVDNDTEPASSAPETTATAVDEPATETAEQKILPSPQKRGTVIERAMAFINPNFNKFSTAKEEPVFTKAATPPLEETQTQNNEDAVENDTPETTPEPEITVSFDTEIAPKDEKEETDNNLSSEISFEVGEQASESDAHDVDGVEIPEKLESEENHSDEVEISAPEEQHAHDVQLENTPSNTVDDSVIEVTDDDIFMEGGESSPFEEVILDELTTEPPAPAENEVAAVLDEESIKEPEELNDELTLATLKSTLKQIVGYIKKEDANHNRSRDSLYNILTAIYEFHATCETSPKAYGELVQEHDLKVQSRAPFTPILKICLGKDYDKTRLTEYAAALGIARYMNIDIDEFHAFIKNFPGGIKGCVKEMRVIRKHGASGNITARKTRSIEEAREILREMAPIASFRLKKVIVGNNIDEFCLLLAKRDGHDINVLKILDDKYTKLDPVLKRAAFIKGNLNDRK